MNLSEVQVFYLFLAGFSWLILALMYIALKIGPNLFIGYRIGEKVYDPAVWDLVHSVLVRMFLRNTLLLSLAILPLTFVDHSTVWNMVGLFSTSTIFLVGMIRAVRRGSHLAQSESPDVTK